MDEEEIDAILKLYPEYDRVTGPYQRKADNRKIVALTGFKRTTTRLLAKVRLEVKLGRKLVPGETVDHKDDDGTNDHPDNLQPLSLSENARKSAKIANLENWIRPRVGSKELSDKNAGERSSVATFNNLEVRQLREGFIEFGELREVAAGAPCNRKSLRAILEGRTYQDAGGPLVKFKDGSHTSFEITKLTD